MESLSNERIQEDAEIVVNLASAVATVWNEHGASHFGFKIYVGLRQVVDCCERSNLILENFFPPAPGPFKRAASLLVLGRLNPFFSLDPAPVSRSEREKWLVRMLLLFLPATLGVLEVKVSRSPGIDKWMRLDGWKGFPSPAFKLEFINYLLGLNESMPSLPNGNNDFSADSQVARHILATSMLIESCYYLGESLPKESSLRALRTRQSPQSFDEIDLTYDAHLYRDWALRHE